MVDGLLFHSLKMNEAAAIGYEFLTPPTHSTFSFLNHSIHFKERTTQSLFVEKKGGSH